VTTTERYNGAPLDVIDGETWVVCPVRGAGCMRVPLSLGTWALDAVHVHTTVIHRRWFTPARDLPVW